VLRASAGLLRGKVSLCEFFPSFPFSVFYLFSVFHFIDSNSVGISIMFCTFLLFESLCNSPKIL
jgi:hypothetical protein